MYVFILYKNSVIPTGIYATNVDPTMPLRPQIQALVGYRQVIVKNVTVNMETPIDLGMTHGTCVVVTGYIIPPISCMAMPIHV